MVNSAAICKDSAGYIHVGANLLNVLLICVLLARQRYHAAYA